MTGGAMGTAGAQVLSGSGARARANGGKGPLEPVKLDSVIVCSKGCRKNPASMPYTSPVEISPRSCCPTRSEVAFEVMVQLRLLSAVLGAVAVLCFAAPAHGDPGGNDAAFLAALANAGITVPNPGQAIASGQAVCGLMRNGETGLQVLTDVRMQNPALTLDGAALFTAIASNTYCPERRGIVTSGCRRHPE